VLEVTTAGVFLMGAALFVATVDGPSPMGNQAQEDAREEARTLLDVIAAQEAPDNASANRLAHEVAYSVQGDPILEDHVNRHFPNRDWVLTLEKGDGHEPIVAEDGEPLGEVSTATRLLVPEWTYSWHGARMETLSGKHPMSVASVPVHDSRSDRLAGEPVKVTVVAEEGGDEKRYHVYETLGRPDDEAKNAAMFVQDSGSTRKAALTATYLQDCASSYATEAGLLDGSETVENPSDVNEDEIPCSIKMEFNLPSGRTLAPGTQLKIDIPRGWRFVGISDTQSWQVEGPEEDTIGPMTLTVSITSGESVADGETLRVNLNVTTDPTAPFSVFEARLAHGDDGNGTLSRGEFVVPHPGAEAKGPRATFTSLPYPGEVGGSERWGIAFSNGLSDVTVEEIRVESPSGTSLFSDVAVDDRFGRNCETAGDCGSLEVRADGSVLAWEGSEDVLQGETRDLLLNVSTTATTTNVSDVEERTYPTVTFDNGYSHDLSRQVGGPGIYTDWVPPTSSALVDDSLDSDLLGRDDDGYNATGGDHEVDVEYVPRGELWKVESTFDYEVESTSAAEELALDTQGALAASSLAIEPSRTTPGSVVEADLNASNLLQEARNQIPTDDGAGDLRMEAKLFTPPTLGREPATTMETNLSAGVGQTIATVEAADVTGDGAVEALTAAEDGVLYAYEVTADRVHTSLWSQDLPATPRSLVVGAKGGEARVFAGLDDGTVHALDSKGSEIWDHDVTEGTGNVTWLATTDSTGDGTTDVLWARTTNPGSADARNRSALHRIAIDWDALETTASTDTLVTTDLDDVAASVDGAGIVASYVTDPDEPVRRVQTFDAAGTATLEHEEPARSGGETSDATVLDPDADGSRDLLVLADAPSGSERAHRLLRVEDGGLVASTELDRYPSEMDQSGLLEVVGDVDGRPDPELAYALGNDKMGVLRFSDDADTHVWSASVTSASVEDGSVPLWGAGNPPRASPCDAVEAGGDAGSGRRGAETHGACVYDAATPPSMTDAVEKGPPMDTHVFERGLSPTPLSLDVVTEDGRDRLAVTYHWSGDEVGAASGALRFHDLATGEVTGGPTWTGTEGPPTVADGAGASWVAAGTDRGYLVTARGEGTPTSSQVAEDRAEFRFPLPVSREAFFGSYVFDVALSWSPTDLDARQTVHMVSRFSVQKPDDPRQQGGYVYNAKLSLGTPNQR
jgi:hypothetical protein